MKKISVSGIVAGAAVCSLSAVCLFGCGSSDDGQSDAVVKEEIPATDAASDTEETADSSETEETTVAVEDSSATENSSFDVYQQFLDGDGLVYFDRFDDMSQADRDDYDFFADCLPSGTGYSFSEFCDNYCTGMSMMYPDTTLSVEYAQIDCGNDGVPELAIRTTLEGDTDPAYDLFIFKQIDDRIQCIFVAGYGYRTEATLNQYGYFVSSGSNSAFSSGTTAKYINADGQIMFDYSVEDIFSAGGLWIPDVDIETPAQEQGIADKIEILQYSFEQADDSTDFTEYYKNCMYYFIPTDENFNPLEGDDLTAAYADGSPYMTFWESTGLSLYTADEINAAVADREAEIGVTDEIKNGTEADWTPVSGE